MSALNETGSHYLVLGGGQDAEEFRAKADAVATVVNRPGAVVMRVAEAGGLRSRRRVWPTLGPVFTEAR